MTSLPDLPAEILLQIISYFMTPVPLSQEPFWDRGITPHTLLSPNGNTREQRKLQGEQAWMAKSLSLVCQRMRAVFLPFVWSRFDCSNLIALRELRNACASERELGSYVQHLDLQLGVSEVLFSLDVFSSQLAAVWPRLTSLHSLTLTLSPNNPCQSWLAEQLRDVPTLRSLSLRIYGSSLGPHLRTLPQLETLSIEIHPDALGLELISQASDPTPREAYHDWTGLFNDVVEMVEACVKDGDVKVLNLFVHWTMVHSFYRHVEKSPSLSSLLALVQNSNQNTSVALGPSIRQFVPSNLNNLSRLSLTLESQMGAGPFLRAAGGLPITDLALTSYDMSLLSGTVFRDFCATFGKLRSLRLKLRNPSIGVGGGGGPIEDEFIDQNAFVQGLASLKNLEAYKGPVLLRRRILDRRSSKGAAQESLDEVIRALRESGALSPDFLLQLHVWLNGVYGPKEFWTIPHEPVKLGDWKSEFTRA
ncbi:hypothetical protein BDV93DRAFT_504572 [Ceratobasidium sp. AG-I]|nr:hypothetical protein BDV93DRAFT_504572 [Ceratobasidium sp. AG-I]